LGLYKELLDLIEAKAWRVNELVILTIHLAEVMEDVIEVLAIDILPPFSNRRHSHVEEIRTSALRKMADSNLNSDTKDRSFDVASALPLVAMLSRRGV
jgi:hypothetical protein